MKKCGINVLLLILSMIIMAMLSACNNSVGNDINNSPSQLNSIPILTIDNASIVPVFGNLPTSTKIYIHNHSKSPIQGVQYSLTTTNLSSQDRIGLGVNTAECTKILANQSCALTITTPTVPINGQGTMLLKASYQFAGKERSFSQLINYASVESTITLTGVKFSAGISMYNYGYQKSYATLYMYATGAANQEYQIKNITIDNPQFKISQITESIIKVNTVHAIEVSSETNNTTATATINSNLVSDNQHVDKNLTTQFANLNGNISFSNSTTITTEPVSSGAILTTSIVPLINTVTTTSGAMLIQNSGNQPAVLGIVSAGSGISSVSGCSNQTLATGETCTINFAVTESGGSANITIPYSGSSTSSVVGNVTWFNGIGAALVSMSALNNPVSFFATVGGSTVVTISNIGGYTLNNISIPVPIVLGGDATVTIRNNSCQSSSLGIGDTCSYEVVLADSATDLHQQINLGFRASYSSINGMQTYSRIMPLEYSSTSYSATISLTPTSESFNIIGNNIESVSKTLLLLNSGNAAAGITVAGLNNAPTYLTAGNNCPNSLSAGESCVITVNLGPVAMTTESNGQATYTIDYSASGQASSGSVSSNLTWYVTAFNPNLLIFVTTNTFWGGYILSDANNSTPAPDPLLTDGLAAGDYLCNLQAATNPTTYPGTYKALLAGTNRVPGGSDWVLQANQVYINQAGNIIGITDADAKLPNQLTNPISSISQFVWSGFDANWGVSSNTCNTWTSRNSQNGGIGSASELNYSNSSYPPGYLYGEDEGQALQNCYGGGSLAIYCVQQ